MVSKKIFVILGVIVVMVVFILFGFSGPKDNALRASVKNGVNSAVVSSIDDYEHRTVSPTASSFEFEGFGPGKSHIGGFDEWTADLFLDNEKIVGFEGTIQAGSVNTGIGGLDKHLKTNDFFDVEKYPEIKFTSNSLYENYLTGILEFHGVSQEVTFPVIISSNGISSDFILDTTPFGIKYSGINKEVRIAFDLVM